MLSKTKAQAKRTDILKTAQELFLERGYDAVSLDDILERVGGSKTTLYSYYGCKKGLFAATVNSMCEEKLGPLLAMDLTNLDPKDGLNSIGRQFLRILSEPDSRAFFRAMIAEAQRFPELASIFFAAGPRTTLQILQQNIARWQKKGLLRRGDAAAFAAQFIGLMIGDLHLKSLLGIMEPLTEKQIKGWVERGTQTFLEGARPRE